MSEHIEADNRMQQHAEATHQLAATHARRVDVNTPRIDPAREAQLPSDPDDYKDEREDSILPEEAQGFLDKLGRGARKARGATLNALPAFVVNNGSNFVGWSHLGGEFMMIKAYSPIKTAEDLAAMQGKNRSVEEIKLFLKGVTKSLPMKMSFTDVVNPEFYADNFRALKDLGYAAERDLAAYGRISNRWGMRSTALGMSGMALSAVLPETAETEEEVERMIKLREESPLGYVGARIGQAFNPLEWTSHKRQLAGLGLVGGGTASFLNGMMSATGGVKYTRNWGHAFGGAITAAAAAQLMLSDDNEQGWQNFGKTMTLRMLTLPNSIAGKYINKQDGRHWYVGGQGMFRLTDATAYLVGGAEKLPDGTILDKQAIRKEAEMKARGMSEDIIVEQDATQPDTAGEARPKGKPTKHVAEIAEHARQAEPEHAVAAG